jgi:hypothetical protein
MAAMGEVPDIARHVVATCSSHPILPILAPKTVLPGLFKVAFDFIIINYKPLAWYDRIYIIFIGLGEMACWSTGIIFG